MSSSTTLAFADRTLAGWLVSCLRCRQEVGTMTSEVLRYAVLSTANRGGVLCPECRSTACVKCGFDLSDDKRADSEKGFCVFCALELTDRTQAPLLPACLDSHISNDKAKKTRTGKDILKKVERENGWNSAGQ